MASAAAGGIRVKLQQELAVNDCGDYNICKFKVKLF